MRLLLPSLLLGVIAVAQAGPEQVYEYRLDNGMQVLVKEDHRAPIAVSQVWYKVGASYEPDGITGISHVLEHMMFKGTERHGPGEFSRIIAQNGGEENAFTGADYTAYFQTLAADRLEVSFELEADRMRNLRLAPEEFAKEVEVVKEERRLRTEDKPNALTYEQFNAVGYRVLPYRNPVIGWMNDLENLKAEDLQAWYRKWYAPNNATLVVVGDVQPEQVLALAKKHFGSLQAEEIPTLKPLKEPPHRGMVRTVVKAPAKQPYLILGYQTPVLKSAEQEWEPYALEMLAAILGDGDSSRLARELVRGRALAVSADADYSAFSRLGALLSLDAIPAGETTVEQLEQALRAQVARLRDEPVSDGELERVRNQVLANKVYELDSVFYQAMQLGVLETVGLDWRLAFEYPEKIKAVTAEQVQAVANKYLIDDALTVAVLEPRPMDQQKPRQASVQGMRNDI